MSGGKLFGRGILFWGPGAYPSYSTTLQTLSEKV